MSLVYLATKERQCDGKHSFRNSHDAKVAARQTNAVFGGRRLNAYRCPHCARYHVGHAASWRRHVGS